MSKMTEYENGSLSHPHPQFCFRHFYFRSKMSLQGRIMSQVTACGTRFKLNIYFRMKKLGSEKCHPKDFLSPVHCVPGSTKVYEVGDSYTHSCFPAGQNKSTYMIIRRTMSLSSELMKQQFVV